MDKKSVQEIENLTREFLGVFNLSGNITSDIVEDEEGNTYLKVKVEGENLSEVIGYHGKGIDSLQHLVSLSYNRDKEEDERVRVLIDINDYRAKREEYLVSVAEKAYLNVIETKQPMTLPPMRPSERRIIHLRLQEEEGVETTSEGEEPNRHIIIKPSGK